MNDPTQITDIEHRLKQAPLVAPSRKLDDRMSVLFAAANKGNTQTPDVLNGAWARWSMIWAAAACLALGCLLWLSQHKDPAHPAGNPLAILPYQTVNHDSETTLIDFNPVRIEESWSRMQPRDLIVIDGDPLRRFHRQTIDRVQLIDEKHNIHIEYTLPRQDMVITPVRYD